MLLEMIRCIADRANTDVRRATHHDISWLRLRILNCEQYRNINQINFDDGSNLLRITPAVQVGTIH